MSYELYAHLESAVEQALFEAASEVMARTEAVLAEPAPEAVWCARRPCALAAAWPCGESEFGLVPMIGRSCGGNTPRWRTLCW